MNEKKLAECASLQILERISENIKQFPAKSHVEYRPKKLKNVVHKNFCKYPALKKKIETSLP